jgi:transcriptional regulator with XRE-family HTH domain
LLFKTNVSIFKQTIAITEHELLKNRNIGRDILVKELLRALRGRRSQRALSQRLGYSFNQVAKWESGHKKILWNEFVDLCTATKTPLAKSLASHYKYSGESSDASQIISMLIQVNGKSTSAIGRQLEISRHSLSSWLKSKSYPSVHEVLHLLSLYRGGKPHVISFVASLVGNSAMLPSIGDVVAQREGQIALAYQHPWLSAAAECLQLRDYRESAKHIPGFISKHLGISIDEEQMALSFLMKIGAITERNRKFAISGSSVVFQENVLADPNDQEGNFRVREYWWEKALTHLRNRPSWKSLTFAFQTFAVSKEADKKIRDASIRYYQEIERLVEDDTQPKEIFRIMNLCFFSPIDK